MGVNSPSAYVAVMIIGSLLSHHARLSGLITKDILLLESISISFDKLPFAVWSAVPEKARYRYRHSGHFYQLIRNRDILEPLDKQKGNSASDHKKKATCARYTPPLTHAAMVDPLSVSIHVLCPSGCGKAVLNPCIITQTYQTNARIVGERRNYKGRLLSWNRTRICSKMSETSSITEQENHQNKKRMIQQVDPCVCMRCFLEHLQ